MPKLHQRRKTSYPAHQTMLYCLKYRENKTSLNITLANQHFLFTKQNQKIYSQLQELMEKHLLLIFFTKY